MFFYYIVVWLSAIKDLSVSGYWDSVFYINELDLIKIKFEVLVLIKHQVALERRNLRISFCGSALTGGRGRGRGRGRGGRETERERKKNLGPFFNFLDLLKNYFPSCCSF